LTRGKVEYIFSNPDPRMRSIGRRCQFDPVRVVRPRAVKYH
jgi:hypothetical protein